MLKYIGGSIDEELHRKVKIRCTEMGIKIQDGLVVALYTFLDLPVDEVNRRIDQLLVEGGIDNDKQSATVAADEANKT